MTFSVSKLFATTANWILKMFYLFAEITVAVSESSSGNPSLSMQKCKPAITEASTQKSLAAFLTRALYLFTAFKSVRAIVSDALTPVKEQQR